MCGVHARVLDPTSRQHHGKYTQEGSLAAGHNSIQEFVNFKDVNVLSRWVIKCTGKPAPPPQPFRRPVVAQASPSTTSSSGPAISNGSGRSSAVPALQPRPAPGVMGAGSGVVVRPGAPPVQHFSYKPQPPQNPQQPQQQFQRQG